jgi:glyoxylase-like metal-dependent hydrolase (beta-lactamase superfamily II)
MVAYSRRHGALFVGDLVRTTGGRLHLGPSFFNINEELIITSLWNIINAGFEVRLVLPGHGPPIRSSLDELEELAKRLERRLPAIHTK